MAYSLFFLLESFKNPLPWGSIDSTGQVGSSVYFYENVLNISDSIEN